MSPACHEEAQIIDVLKKVKAIDANVSTILYYNSDLDFAQYDLHAQMLADTSLMLHGKNGRCDTIRCMISYILTRSEQARVQMLGISIYPHTMQTPSVCVCLRRNAYSHVIRRYGESSDAPNRVVMRLWCRSESCIE